MKKTVFALWCLIVSISGLGCSKDSSTTPPPQQETYYIKFEFDPTSNKSPEGYLYGAYEYNVKGTLLNSKDEIIEDTLDWTWTHLPSEWPAFRSWPQDSGVKHSQSGVYMIVETYNISNSGENDYGDGRITIKSVSKGVEITTTVRVIKLQ